MGLIELTIKKSEISISGSVWNFTHLRLKTKGKKIIKTIFVRMRLEIHRVQAEDFTSYKCVAKNSLGETDGKIRLFGKIEL